VIGLLVSVANAGPVPLVFKVKVAVKILYQPDAKDETHKKALDLVKNLNHPYLLKTHAYWVHEGRLHVVMELADGSLRGRLKKSRRQRQDSIAPAALLDYVEEAAEALDYLHGFNLIHRNITPDNLLLLKSHIKVSDFSHVCDSAAPGETTGGTIGYMAPECYRGSVTRHSDQYSLAIVYQELLTSQRPFNGKNARMIANQHLNEEPELRSLPDVRYALLASSNLTAWPALTTNTFTGTPGSRS
jgi:serine/threonine protein kinase